MNRYRVTAWVRKTYAAEKETTFEVKAENADEAKKIAEEDADDHVSFSVSFDCELEETETDVTAVEFIEGDNPPDTGITRCSMTPDFFGEVIA